MSEAIDAYSRELETNPSPLPLANRALARLRLGDFEGAIADYQRADEIEEPSARGDAYLKRGAAALWLMGREEEAVAAWESIVDNLAAGEYRFTDAAGGVQSTLLLWFGAASRGDARLQQKATAFLKKLLKKAASRSWPGPIGSFVLHQLEYPELMQAATTQESLVPRRACQAVFYGAIRARVEQEDRDVADLLDLAVSYGEELPMEIEYYLAAHELKRSS